MTMNLKLKYKPKHKKMLIIILTMYVSTPKIIEIPNPTTAGLAQLVEREETFTAVHNISDILHIIFMTAEERGYYPF